MSQSVSISSRGPGERFWAELSETAFGCASLSELLQLPSLQSDFFFEQAELHMLGESLRKANDRATQTHEQDSASHAYNMLGTFFASF